MLHKSLNAIIRQKYQGKYLKAKMKNPENAKNIRNTGTCFAMAGAGRYFPGSQ
jgi:hypothetical protein